MIKTVNTTLTVLDPLPGRLVQVEALLAERVDASRSPLEGNRP